MGTPMTKRTLTNPTKRQLPGLETRTSSPAKPEKGFSASLLKSATQKAIRRGDVGRALISAKAHLRKAPNDFFRRLPIMILEDAILHPDFRKVVELAGHSARKAFVVTKEIEHFALTIVEQLAKIEIRDYSFVAYNNGFKSINIVPYVEWEDLRGLERDTVKAIKWREKMSGMKDDMNMLSFLTRIWAHRFKEKILTMRKLKALYDRIPTRKSYASIPSTLTVNDILLEAVDFHVSPMVDILAGKRHVRNLIERHYPDDVLTVEERIQTIIWRMRSGINYKKDYFSGEPIDWLKEPFNRTPNADRPRYEAIYASLLPEINNISIWFLEKNK